MRSIIYTGRFKKDLKRQIKQGADVGLLREVILKLQNGETLEAKFNDHPLFGKLTGKRDCHITSDWVLIYALDDQSLTLYRTGSHTELYG
jgi:mRNA interferase YafQ